MKRHLTLAVLTAVGLAVAPVAHAANCGERTKVVEKLASKYDEHLTAGGLHKTRSAQSIMEIWSSSTTGTFTVLITSPQGISCVVAAGTDFFEAEEMPRVKGSAS